MERAKFIYPVCPSCENENVVAERTGIKVSEIKESDLIFISEFSCESCGGRWSDQRNFDNNRDRFIAEYGHYFGHFEDSDLFKECGTHSELKEQEKQEFISTYISNF